MLSLPQLGADERRWFKNSAFIGIILKLLTVTVIKIMAMSPTEIEHSIVATSPGSEKDCLFFYLLTE